MSRISIPAVGKATGTTAEVYARIKKAAGRVPNVFAVIGALQPAALGAVLDADAALAAGSLSRKDIETIKLVVSVTTGGAFATIVFTNVFNRINDTEIDFPAVA